MRLTRLEEELLEAIWTAREQGTSTLENVGRESEEDVLSVAGELEQKGYVTRRGDAIALTERGRESARSVVRCHRVAECLMWHGLRTGNARMEQVACAFEHVLLPEIVDSICVLLGHPRLCPHGKPIPPGTCCEEVWESVSRALSTVADLEPGRTAVIACLRPEDPGGMERLLALHLVPGTEVTVRQTQPAVILLVGESQLAIDRGMASQVFVWTRSPGTPIQARRRRRRGWRPWAGRGSC